MFFKKNNSATPTNFDENFDLDIIKAKISKNKQNMLEEDRLKHSLAVVRKMVERY